MPWYADPQWWIVIIAPSVAVLSIFYDWIRSLIWKPELEVSIKLKPPDCQKVPLIDPKTHRYIAESYYFRFRMENTGNFRMEDVEVMITDLYKKTSENKHERQPFLPLNLRWSHSNIAVIPRIQSDLYKHCDFGHIIKSETAKASHYDLPRPVKIVFLLDTIVKPTTGTFLLLPGDYRVRIIVGASNIKPEAKIYNLVIKDNWTDDEQKMLTENISIEEVDSLY